MNQTLIATAVVITTAALASSVAHAQSSVVVGGAVDAYVESTKAGGGTVKRVSSGGVTGSRLTIRGTEDLGSGLRATFVLDHDLLVDAGTPAAAKFWNRQSLVGLGGEAYGTLSMGRQYTPYFATIAFGDPLGFTMGSVMNYFAYPVFPVAAGRPNGGINGTLADSTTRRDNSVAYVSPSYAGVTGRLFVSAGEGTDARVRSGSLAYAGKGLTGSIAYLSEKTTYLVGNTDKFTGANLAYDFGVVKPAFTFARRRGEAAAAPDVDAWQIGATVPLGAGTLGATWAKLKNKGNDIYSASGWGVRYDHALSRRTKLYAGATAISNNAGAGFLISGGGSSSPGLPLTAPGADPRSVFVGVSHLY